jgi:hypothetical protein
MKDLTAMQQLKQKLQHVIDNEDLHAEYKLAYQNVIKDIDAQMLTVEREQIIDFCTQILIEDHKIEVGIVDELTKKIIRNSVESRYNELNQATSK